MEWKMRRFKIDLICVKINIYTNDINNIKQTTSMQKDRLY